MTYEEIIQNIRKEMLKVNKALSQGKLATINTEIVIANIQGNESLQGDIRALNTIANYYLDMMDSIDKSGQKINEYLHMIEELEIKNN